MNGGRNVARFLGLHDHILGAFRLPIPEDNQGIGIVGHQAVPDRPCGLAVLLPVGREPLDSIAPFKGILLSEAVCTSGSSADDDYIVCLHLLCQKFVTRYLKGGIVIEAAGTGYDNPE